MWIIFSIFLVLWLLGIEFYIPPVVTLFFFVAMIGTAVFALMPSHRKGLDWFRG